MTDGISILLHAASLFVQAALMSAVALGAWTAMNEPQGKEPGGALYFFRRLVSRSGLPVFWRQPFADCPRCMCSVWGITALLVCGFGVGITINLAPDNGLLHFNEAMLLVETEPLPLVAIDWPRLAEIPLLILAAVGIQEMWHRP